MSDPDEYSNSTRINSLKFDSDMNLWSMNRKMTGQDVSNNMVVGKSKSARYT